LPPLLPDSFYTTTTHVQLPVRSFGKHYIYILTNGNRRVFEYVFDNNNVGRNDSLNIILTPPSDFVVTDVVSPASASAGEKVNVNYTVKNVGGSRPIFSPKNDGFKWADGLYISTNPTFNINDVTFVKYVLPLTFQPTGGGIIAAPATIRMALFARKFFSFYPIMNPQESYNYNFEFDTPNLPAGTYYLYVLTDITDSVYEYDKENNNFRRATLVITNPDLTVTTLNTIDSSSSGADLNIDWTIKNNGPGKLIKKYRSDAIILSSSATYNVNSIVKVESRGYDNALDSGATLNRSSVFKLPDGISGNYYLFIQTDDINHINEGGNENNNLSAAKAINIQLSPAIDLRPDSVLTTADTLTAGTTFRYSYNVYNRGIGPLLGVSLQDKVFVSKSPVFNGQAKQVAIHTRPLTLQKDEFTKVSDSVTLTLQFMADNGLTPGDCYFFVFTDAADQVFEYNAEGNNVARSKKLSIKLPLAPDLSFVSITRPDSASSGKQIIVKWSVKNAGGNTSLYTNTWKDFLVLSADTVLDKNDTVLFSTTINLSITQQGVYGNQQSATIPNGLQGNYYLFMVTDSLNQTKDSYRPNNILLSRGSNGVPASIYITLTPSPDFAILNFTGPSTGTGGQPIVVKATVTNQGTADAIGSRTDRVYLSLDQNLDTSDKAIGVGSPANLAVNATATDSCSFYLPTNKAGNYYLIYVVNDRNTIYEHNGQNNNQAVYPIFIMQMPPVDFFVSTVAQPQTVIIGDTLTVKWKVSNLSENFTDGYETAGIYFSKDSAFSADDQLVNDLTERVWLSSKSTVDRQQNFTLKDVSPGDYFVLVRENILNNVPENNLLNNLGISINKIRVATKVLPLYTSVPDILSTERPLYYRVDIPDSLVGETISVKLSSTVPAARNELYARFDSVPLRNKYDFTFSIANSANQELIIPAAKKGSYYIMAYSANAAVGPRAVTLYARKIGFEITDISAKEGGNTGSVTVKITGARFESGMTFSLVRGVDSINARTIKFINSTTVYATLDLNSKPIGLYNIKLKKSSNAVTELQGAFSIVAGSGGGSSNGGGAGNSNGFFCSIGNEGTSSLLNISLDIPPYMLIGRTVPITLNFGNSGNVDIPIPQRMFVSLNGLPMAFDITDIPTASSEVLMIFKEAGGPDDVLRPGATGSITIFVKAVSATEPIYGHKRLDFKLIE
ncbi:MAG: hypothetical protein EOP48_00180, partial [Sphingobacteriales bacterium]